MSWDVVDLSKLGDRPAVRPTVGGIVYPGRRHLFSGPPEGGKTTAAYALALEELRAGRLVLLIDLEMGRFDARDLLVDLGATGEDLGRLLYVDPETAPTGSTMMELIDPYRESLSLAIIDAAAGAYALSGLDDQKRLDAERWASLWVQPLRDAGVATITIDHVTKNADSRGKYAIGTERKVGQVDVHLGFEYVGDPFRRGGEAVCKIVTHRDRPGWLQRPRAAELELSSDPETHAISWAFRQPGETAGDETWRPTVLMDRVLAHVGRYGYEPVARTTLAREVPGRHVFVLRAIDLLLDEGRLRLNDDGKVVAP
jgi:hypothetical protein